MNTNREILSDRLSQRNNYIFNENITGDRLNSYNYLLNRKNISITQPKKTTYSNRELNNNTLKNLKISTSIINTDSLNNTRDSKKSDILNNRLQAFQPLSNNSNYPLLNFDRLAFDNKPINTRNMD